MIKLNFSMNASYLSELSIASPKPGVSTTVSRNFTPRSSISTVDASNFTVCLVFAKNEQTSSVIILTHNYKKIQI